MVATRAQKLESDARETPAEMERALPTSSIKKRQRADNARLTRSKRAKTEAANSSHEINPRLSRLISTFGVFPLQALNPDDSTTPRPERILALVLNAMLSSARTPHHIANETVKCVIEAKYHHIDVLEASTWEEKIQVLTKGGYTQYREEMATALEDLAKLVREKYKGDLDNLVLRSKSSPTMVRNCLKEVEILTNVDINIFFGFAQGIWPCLAPFIDSWNLDVAERLKMGVGVEDFWVELDNDPVEMAKLCVALNTMSIFDDARRGALIGARLDNWLRNSSNALNSQDPSTGWTLLATAVVSGFPKQVEQLLERGAKATLRCKNRETPLLLAAWKTSMERPLIVQMLLSKVPKGSIDDTCDLAENNTPLMCAIEKLDVDSVRLLAKAGARLHIQNDDGFNAVEVAKNTGKQSLCNALKPEEEQSFLGRLASNVITFGRHVVSWVDNKFNGFMGKMFGFKGENQKSTEKKFKAMKPGPEEPTPQEFVKHVDTYVKDTPALEAFFKDNKQFMQNLAKKTVDLANDPTTDLGSPEVLPKTIKVTMHQQVLYCDDSGSMVNAKGRAESRWENQKLLALRIARTTTRILPDGEGVALRFINQTTNESPSLDLDGIQQALNSATARGDTAIGTTLRERILKPLVYNPLAAGTLKRPLLVSILTDGGPAPEAKGTLASVIVECGNELVRKGYPRDCVKFLIGQIGSSTEAVEFLDTLRGNPDIASVSHIFAGRFDDKFKSFRDERKLDRWLVETLFKPLAAAEAKKKDG
ncbi:hypothetical protein EG329_008494 [Mollisiaceae sp. DMI_Dod_QoI]|nr:hypothetical protein EG329_008494 [Helotiales sp. DMI_Dod_QoI]